MKFEYIEGASSMGALVVKYNGDVIGYSHRTKPEQVSLEQLRLGWYIPYTQEDLKDLNLDENSDWKTYEVGE